METQPQSKTRPRRPKGSREHGIAVLLVVACLAILAPFTASFNYQARVDWQSAVNVRDEVAARQIERGAMQLSLMLFEIQRLVFNQQQFRDFMGSMDITQVAPYLMSIFGTTDGAEGIGAFVGMDVDTTALSELALSSGTFEYRVYAESGKLNVNCVSLQSDERDNPAGRTIETLEALMAPAIFDPLFEEEKADGQFYTRTDLTMTLADYIDDDDRRFDVIRLRSGSSQENYRYQELHDAYQARNGRLDSVDELHLVQGIDDDWMTAFGHELTVYGGCKVNLNFASAEQIALVLRYAVRDEDRWKTEGENFLLKTIPLANFVVQYRDFNLFEDLDQFAQLVEKPDEFMSMSPAMLGQSAEQSTGMPMVPDGMMLNKRGGGGGRDGKGGEGEDGTGTPEDGEKQGGLADVATIAPERIYTVEVTTNVGNVNKRMTAVYDMQYPRAQSQGKGAWLHVRED